MVASKKGEEEQEGMEMREKTPLAMVTEVEPVVSGGEVEQEVKEAMEVEKDGEESNKEEATQQQHSTATAWARFAVAKWSLVTVAGYQGNCQAFLAWQEANVIGKEDWEEGEMGEVPSNNTNLDA
ncbi:hypothetical protein E4T56_gene8005 [Termitomyces sp. T112]|nr:hypothetical protein C0989_011946 [Termitomyces sp. Mn162]KAG5724723.1 hypothetical protein E4T56_gene8005 [Termitomyces sp. T112]